MPNHLSPQDDVAPDTVAADVRYLTTDQAAAVAGKNRETIRRWIRSGELVAHMNGRSFDVLESSLLAKLGRSRRAPEGGGIFDPDWGPFTRDPFHSD